MEDVRITHLRTCLDAYFEQRAAEANVLANLTVRDPWATVLAGRIYEEMKDDRIFIVSPRELRGVDAFIKRTGLEDEKFLLQVFTEFSVSYFPVLWDLYFEWVHKGSSEAVVLGILQSVQRE